MRHATDHRPAILKQAARFFASRSYHEVLMEDVARAAGIAKGTVYRFYPNKDRLYLAVCLEWMNQHATGVLGASETPGSELERLEGMIRSSAEHFRRSSDFFHAMQRADLYPNITRTPEFLQLRGRVRLYFAQAIAQAQQAGVLKPLEPQVAGDLLLGMIRSLQRFGDPKRPSGDTARIILDVFVSGMQPVNSAERAVTAHRPKKNRREQPVAASL